MTEHQILRLGIHGDGIAKGPVFADRTLPGEMVTGSLVGQTLQDVRIQSPSDARVTPPCPHFKACGGCKLQHAQDDFVAAWKTDVVRQALKARGLQAEFRPIHTSPGNARRRATFAAKRVKKGVLVGFHSRASDVVIDIPNCTLLHPDLVAGRTVAHDLARLGASRKAALAVTITTSIQGLDVAVSGGKSLDGPLRISLAQLADKSRLARLCWGDEVVAMRQPPTQTFGKARVLPPPGAFLQATAEGETALVSAVVEALDGTSSVADLFAGCGTFTFPLAASASVHAVEGAPEMIAALDRGWRHTSGLKSVTHEARDLFRRPLLPDELMRFDGIALDPPRAGAEQQVIEIAKAKIPKLAFVSCNPVTFARDAEILVGAGYDLNWVQVVDQFRWSAHIELAAAFSLN